MRNPWLTPLPPYRLRDPVGPSLQCQCERFGEGARASAARHQAEKDWLDRAAAQLFGGPTNPKPARGGLADLLDAKAQPRR